MKVTDIIRGILDLIDQEDAETVQPVVVVTHTNVEGDDIERLKQNAGLEYNNTPQEVIAPIAASFPSGTDMHHSKNPADIRTDAPSMFPGFQIGAR